MSVRILIGDVREQLRGLPDASVHCVVTSPPYWGLRDYGVAGQIGLEADYRLYIETMVAVFREVRRVLRSDGTLWLNLGDSYAATTKGSGGHNPKQDSNKGAWFDDGLWKIPLGLKPKDLTGIPWRVAFALQEDGWWLRQDIIWSKPNPMPESVTDRCTKAHEYLFLLSKSQRYYFDAAAINEPAIHAGKVVEYDGTQKNCAATRDEKMRTRIDQDVLIKDTRNRRSVWEIPAQPFSEAHFATFPPALVEPCVLAGSPPAGTVLDPFGGAGTVGLVADRVERNAILIELNPAYAALARNRIQQDAGMFAEIAE